MSDQNSTAYPIEINVTDEFTIVKASVLDVWSVYGIADIENDETRGNKPLIELDSRLSEEQAIQQVCRLQGALSQSRMDGYGNGEISARLEISNAFAVVFKPITDAIDRQTDSSNESRTVIDSQFQEVMNSAKSALDPGLFPFVGKPKKEASI